MKEASRFILGINYWPRETAMYWWKNFEPSPVKRDFSLLAEYRLELLRIFLLWEDFQPEMNRVSVQALNHLVRVADMAHEAKLEILPTFFCGHMSGMNWLPPWMLGTRASDGRFPIFSQGRIQRAAIRNMYTDREVWKAQRLLLHETSNALEGHPAVWGWDLGNEPSNLALPPSRDWAKAWLEEMVIELKRRENLPVTLGIQQKDLEEDRCLGPQEAAFYCEFLSMHAYSGIAQWADGPWDEKVPLFLCLLTRWLGGKDVLLGALGVPTEPFSYVLSESEKEKLNSASLAKENDTEIYYSKALELLRRNGFMGALAWSFSDYDPALWDKPPLDDRIHERYLGLFRWNGVAKGFVESLSSISRERESPETGWDWIDIERSQYYQRPSDHVKHLYGNFKDWLGDVD